MLTKRETIENIIFINKHLSNVDLLDIHLKAENHDASSKKLEHTTPREWADLCIKYAADDRAKYLLKSLVTKAKKQLRSKDSSDKIFKIWLNEFGPKMMESAANNGAEKNLVYLSNHGIEDKKLEKTNIKEKKYFINTELAKGISKMLEINQEMGDKDLQKIANLAQNYFSKGFEISAKNREKRAIFEEEVKTLETDARSALSQKDIKSFKAIMEQAQNAKREITYEDSKIHLISIESLSGSYRLKNEHKPEIADIILREILSAESCNRYELYVSFCNEIYVIARESYIDASEYLFKAEKVIDNHKTEISDQRIGFTYHNLGLHYGPLDIEKSIEYFEKTLTYLKYDEDTINELASLYAFSKDHEKLKLLTIINPDKSFKLIANASLDIDDAELFFSHFKSASNKKLWKKLKNDFFEKEITLHRHGDCMIAEAFYNSNPQDIHKIAITEVSRKPSCTKRFIANALDRLLDLGAIEIAQNLLKDAEKISPNYETNSLPIINFEYEKLVLNLRIQNIKEAESYFQKIVKYKEEHDDSIRAKLLTHIAAEKLLSAHIDLKDYESAKSYLIHTEERDKLGQYIAKLQKAQENANIMHVAKELLGEIITKLAENILEVTIEEVKSEDAIATEAQANIQEFKDAHSGLPDKVQTLVHMLNTNQIDIDILDPKYIQAYFMYMKAVSANQSVSDTLRDINCWHSKSGTYQLSKGSNIVKLEIPHYYAMISPDLELSGSLKKKFKDALYTGRIAGKHNETGVKFCNGKFVELKIFGADGAGDNRLFTNKICINENGDYLIIFDTHGTHKNSPKSGEIEIYHSTKGNFAADPVTTETSGAEAACAPACAEAAYENVSHEYIHEAQQYYSEVLGSDFWQTDTQSI